MNATMPSITFSRLVVGFEEWFVSNWKIILPLYTPDQQERFETVEDFAVEIFGTMLEQEPEIIA